MTDHSNQPVVDSEAAEQVVRRLNALWGNDRIPPTRTSQANHPTHIDRFEVLEVLGHGAFGIVYRALDEQLGREVALKIPHPHVLIDSQRHERFVAEAATAAMLDHPAIVSVYEANLQGPSPYIVTALCAGPDLARWLSSQNEPPNPVEAARFLARLAEGVQYAHDQGVLHRDLKPANVMLEPVADPSGARRLSDFEPRLTDFGLAKLVQAGLHDTRSSVVLGTPLYMAPEQLVTGLGEVSPQTDVYALGAMLYELLTLRTPIEGASYFEVFEKVRQGGPRPLRDHGVDVPRDLETVCFKCLEKDPADRYASASDLAEDLERHLAGRGIDASPVAWGKRLSDWSKRPERIRDAGVFMIAFHLLSTLWLLTCAVLIPQFQIMNHTEYLMTLGEVLLAIAAVDTSMLIIGWQTLTRKLWAILVGLLASTGQLLLFVYSLTLSEGAMFKFVYRGAQYHAASNNALLLICCVAQLLLFCLALRAWRDLQKLAPHSNS